MICKSRRTFLTILGDDRQADHSFLLLAVADRPGAADAGLRLQMGLQRRQDSAKPGPLTGSTPMKPGQWHHVVAVRDGNILRLHLDGREIGRGRAAQTNPAFTRMLVGRLNIDPSKSRFAARALNGCIDELAIFERALNRNEIVSLAKGAHGREPEAAEVPGKPDDR